MNKREECVQEFHQAFGHPVNNGWNIKNLNLRMKLLKEELAEVQAEIDVIVDILSLGEEANLFHLAELQDAVVNLLKELGDLQYVLSGMVVAIGAQGFFDRVVEEVHVSNMSKLEDGRILRREDGKILKGKYYKEANVQQFYNKIGGFIRAV